MEMRERPASKLEGRNPMMVSAETIKNDMAYVISRMETGITLPLEALASGTTDVNYDPIATLELRIGYIEADFAELMSDLRKYVASKKG
jgi:hypothetical protein